MAFGDTHVRTASEAIEDVKESIMEETRATRPTVVLNATNEQFVNIHNVTQTAIFIWFTMMALIATLILFDAIRIDSGNRDEYVGSAVIITAIMIIIMIGISNFHQEQHRYLSKQHILNINLPWMTLVPFAIAIALSYPLLNTEIEDDIGSHVFDDDDSISVDKLEGLLSEAMLWSFFILAPCVATPYMIKAVMSHARPGAEISEPEFTTRIRKSVELDHRDADDDDGSGSLTRRTAFSDDRPPREKRRTSASSKSKSTKRNPGKNSSSRPAMRSAY